jgi:ribonucleoside-diphosphate reductase alpha chain
MGKTAFTDPAAVDAWDLWFRWRDGTRLRDLTIDTTWERVAHAVASAANTDSTVWAQRYADAFSKWQLLPSERLLCEAGIGRGTPSCAPQAALNAAAFVRQSRGAVTHFDRDEFVRVCALSVRFLDDALIGAGHSTSGLHIGLFGMADALAHLGEGYVGETATSRAREIACAFAEGCLIGDVTLARERGANALDAKRWSSRLRVRGFGGALLSEVDRYGLRHSRLTAIASHPRLALFANNTTDGVDPMIRIDAQRRPAAAQWCDSALVRASSLSAQIAQLELRAAIQPWIDRSIDTPLLTLSEPDETTRTACVSRAAELDLKPPRWRLPDVTTAMRVA